MERVDSTSLPAGTECVGRWLKSDFGWPRTWDGCHGSYAPPADDDRGRVLLYTVSTLIPQRALVSVCRFCGHGELNLRTLHFGKRLRKRTAPGRLSLHFPPHVCPSVFSYRCRATSVTCSTTCSLKCSTKCSTKCATSFAPKQIAVVR